MKFIASIDPGKVNFAFSIEEYDEKKCQDIKELKDVFVLTKTVLLENLNLSKGCDKKKYIDSQIFHNLCEKLDHYKDWWDKCDTILIETQMNFGKNKNPLALKISHFTYSYFIIKYGNTKKLLEYPAYHKTQVLGAPKKLDKPSRKKWSIAKVAEIIKERDDPVLTEMMSKFKKKDDVSDCILMNLSYLVQVYIDKKVF